MVDKPQKGMPPFESGDAELIYRGLLLVVTAVEDLKEMLIKHDRALSAFMETDSEC